MGKLLQLARERSGLSQTEAGELAGFDQPVVKKIESGQYSGSIEDYEIYVGKMGFRLSIEPFPWRRPIFEELRYIFNEDD